MKIYITGASGKLGSAVAKLVDGIPLVRKPCGMKRGVITNFSEEQLRNILKDTDVILHLAGSVDTTDKKKLWESNVELTRRIVNAAPKSCRIILASSISVYGKKLAQIPADENTPVNPDSDYSRSKYEAERIVSAHPNNTNHVILRIGTVYGPQFGDYNLVLSKIERGKMRVLDDGKNRIPFVHVDDVAQAFKTAVGVENKCGIYVLSGEALSQEHIYTIAARELGVEPPRKHINKDLAMLAATAGEFAYKNLGGKKPQLTQEHVAVLAYDRVFDCTKAKKELGFAPRSLETGIKEMVTAYKLAQKLVK